MIPAGIRVGSWGACQAGQVTDTPSIGQRAQGAAGGLNCEQEQGLSGKQRHAHACKHHFNASGAAAWLKVIIYIKSAK